MIVMTTAVHASEFKGTNAPIEACISPANNIKNITKNLSATGWKLLQKNQLNEQMISNLSWIYIAQHFFGNAPKARLKSYAELQNKTVLGMLKKKDIPQSQTRFMQRDVNDLNEMLVVQYLKNTASFYQIKCKFVFSHESMSQTIQWIEKSSKKPASQWPDFVDLPLKPKKTTTSDHTFSASIFNRTTLSQKLDNKVNVAALIQTNSRFQLPKE